MDTVNSAISKEVGVAFEGVWLLLVYWNDVPAADSTEVSPEVRSNLLSNCKLDSQPLWEV